MPYEPDPGQSAPEPQRLVFQAGRESRHTVITAHLKKDRDDPTSWQGLDLDFTGVVFDGGDFRDAKFSGATISFDGTRFCGGTVDFSGAEFSGTVNFNYAQFSGGRIHFNRARFSGGTVFFVHAQFSSMVNFGGAIFSAGKVVFSLAQFSGGEVNFLNARFAGSEVSFDGAGFSGCTVDFSQVANWSSPPAFPWTDTPPPGVKLPTKASRAKA
jgi:hypothetical protein